PPVVPVALPPVSVRLTRLRLALPATTNRRSALPPLIVNPGAFEPSRVILSLPATRNAVGPYGLEDDAGSVSRPEVRVIVELARDEAKVMVSTCWSLMAW